MIQSRIYSSRELHRAYMTRPHWQHPGRREFIHGRIQPANDDRAYGGLIGKLIMFAVAVAAFGGFALMVRP